MTHCSSASPRDTPRNTGMITPPYPGAELSGRRLVEGAAQRRDGRSVALQRAQGALEFQRRGEGGGGGHTDGEHPRPAAAAGGWCGGAGYGVEGDPRVGVTGVPLLRGRVALRCGVRRFVATGHRRGGIHDGPGMLVRAIGQRRRGALLVVRRVGVTGPAGQPEGVTKLLDIGIEPGLA